MTHSKPETLTALIRALGDDDAPALVWFDDDGAHTVDRRGLAGYSRALASGLLREGLEPGARIGLFADNSVPWVVACLGALNAGAIPVPMDAQLAGDRLRHVISDSEPELVFTSERGVKRLEEACADMLSGIPVRRLDMEDGEDPDGWRSLLTDDDCDLPDPDAEDDAVLFYTAGTTGPPKGVPLTHRQVCFELAALADAGVVTDDDRVLLPLPMHHVYPLVTGLLAPLDLALPVILPGSLSGPDLLHALGEGEATLMVGVPRLFQALIDGAEARVAERGSAAFRLFDLTLRISTFLRRRFGISVGRRLLAPVHARLGPQLRRLASGGSPLDPELAWRLEGLGLSVMTGYGLTETAPMVTIHPPGADRFETVGWPLPGVEVRILSREADGDPDQADAGEIAVRGPNVFHGYRNLPEKTREALDEDGWFHTGDLGRIDDDVALRVLGRAATLIVTPGGENVQPDEVEAAYEEIPVVREAGVLERDDHLVALLVPDTSTLDADDALEDVLDAAVRERSAALPSYQRIHGFRMSRDALPRTRLGDIKRHELESRFDEAGEKGEASRGEPMALEDFPDADRELVTSGAGADAWEWLCERYPEEPLGPDTSFRLDLGADSMEWVELSLDLSERTGVVLREETIARVNTVRDLLEAVAESADDGEPGEVLAQAPERLLSARERRLIRRRGLLVRALRYLLHALARRIARLGWRVRVRGLAHVPEEGGWVLAANHTSYLDPVLVAAALDHRRGRDVWWGGWVEIAFGNPLSRLLSRISGVIPVEPKSGGLSALAGAATVLERGDRLVWFPEGERSADGSLKEFRPGLGMVLERVPVPVIPTLIEGTFDAWPPQQRWPSFGGTLTITFGSALETEGGDLAECLRAGILELDDGD